MFASLYLRVMDWTRHQYAVPMLMFVSFIESIFFPIPTDVMLAPMCMATPSRAMYLATWTTIYSVLGGLVGYGLGIWAFPTIVEPFLTHMGYMGHYETIHEWFVAYGFWVVFIAGFSPIPYKVFTVTAGLAGVGFVPFFFASLAGRGGRFYLVAYLMAKGGPRLEKWIHTMLLRAGWALAGLCIFVIAVLTYFHMR